MKKIKKNHIQKIPGCFKQIAAIKKPVIRWVTDLHLDHLIENRTTEDSRPPDDGKVAACDESRIMAALREMAAGPCDLLLVGGDISNSELLSRHLALIGEAFSCPIAFVLGNHDFYHSRIAAVDSEVSEFCAKNERFLHLGEDVIVPLSGETALAGHRGWADCRAGAGRESDVILNDILYIHDYLGGSFSQFLSPNDFMGDGMRKSRETFMNQQGDIAAAAVESTLGQAFESYREVLYLMHVPPYMDAAWHEEQPTSHDFLPYFVCISAGIAMEKVMRDHRDKKLTVLCGHTHTARTFRHGKLPITVHTGASLYGHPRLQDFVPSV